MGLAYEIRREERRRARLGDMGLAGYASEPRPVAPDTLVDVVCLARHVTPDGVTRLPGTTYQLPHQLALRHEAAGLVHPTQAVRVDWFRTPGRVLAAEPLEPDRVLALGAQPGSLKIAQGVGYDPGSAAYRFHSALNEHSKHASAFVRWGDTNPHCSLRQYDGDRDGTTVRQLVYEADVLHCHVDYILVANTFGRARPRGHQLVIRHYHGSLPGGQTCMEHDVDGSLGVDVRLGARLLQLAEPRAGDLQWLPITVPVSRYRALRAWMAAEDDPGNRTFRIAHSPTVRSYKGTEDFLAACRTLQREGIPVQPVLIENLRHGDALIRKATCHATFDSFWLGIQGSGLEAGAMGLPVIAGDETVAALYREHVGQVPYTFANDEPSLTAAIRQLVCEREFYEAEAARVAAYVAAYHDYPVVARRYEAILARALGRDDVHTAPASTALPALTTAPKKPRVRRA